MCSVFPHLEGMSVNVRAQMEHGKHVHLLEFVAEIHS